MSRIVRKTVKYPHRVCMCSHLEAMHPDGGECGACNCVEWSFAVKSTNSYPFHGTGTLYEKMDEVRKYGGRATWVV